VIDKKGVNYLSTELKGLGAIISPVTWTLISQWYDSYKSVRSSQAVVLERLPWRRTFRYLYVFSLNDATKSRLLPNLQIRPRALAVDFAGMIHSWPSYCYTTDQLSLMLCCYTSRVNENDGSAGNDSGTLRLCCCVNRSSDVFRQQWS